MIRNPIYGKIKNGNQTTNQKNNASTCCILLCCNLCCKFFFVSVSLGEPSAQKKTQLEPNATPCRLNGWNVKTDLEMFTWHCVDILVAEGVPKPGRLDENKGWLGWFDTEHMEVPEIGVPPVLIHFSGIFPYKPTILDTPINGNSHISSHMISSIASTTQQKFAQSLVVHMFVLLIKMVVFPYQKQRSQGWITTVTLVCCSDFFHGKRTSSHQSFTNIRLVNWLVVGPPLWKIWTSIGMIRNPILMGK